MNITATTINAASTGSRRGLFGEKGTKRLRRVLAACAVGATLFGATAIQSHPASAAVANGWQVYDVQTNDRCGGGYAIWMHNGVAQPYAWFEFNNDCQWDSYFVDAYPDGQFGEFWFDFERTDAYWDTVIIGGHRWDGQGSGGYDGMSWSGPTDPQGRDIMWDRSTDIYSYVGGAAPSSATAGGAFYNLMTSIARQSGVAVYAGAGGCYNGITRTGNCI